MNPYLSSMLCLWLDTFSQYGVAILLLSASAGDCSLHPPSALSLAFPSILFLPSSRPVNSLLTSESNTSSRCTEGLFHSRDVLILGTFPTFPSVIKVRLSCCVPHFIPGWVSLPIKGIITHVLTLPGVETPHVWRLLGRCSLWRVIFSCKLEITLALFYHCDFEFFITTDKWSQALCITLCPRSPCFDSSINPHAPHAHSLVD